MIEEPQAKEASYNIKLYQIKYYKFHKIRNDIKRKHNRISVFDKPLMQAGGYSLSEYLANATEHIVSLNDNGQLVYNSNIVKMNPDYLRYTISCTTDQNIKNQ